jgi:hypothetical protein
MARQLQEIRVFNSGIISNPDETDIPIEAASNSLNIDSVSKDGVLTGVPLDIAITFVDQTGEEVALAADAISSIEYSGAELFLVKKSEGEWTFAS